MTKKEIEVVLQGYTNSVTVTEPMANPRRFEMVVDERGSTRRSRHNERDTTKAPGIQEGRARTRGR